MGENTVIDATIDTSFVPQLDARQRAMLAEMGVRVWAPKADPASLAAEAADTALAADVPKAAQAPMARAPVETSVRAPAAPPSAAPVAPQAHNLRTGAVKPLPDGVESMDWAALQAAASACEACGLCQRRKNSVFGHGDVQADWMVVGDAPTEAEDAQGLPFVGPEGELLDNMLRAVGQSREKGAYVTAVVKCRPPSSAIPSGEELALCASYLARQVALVQPKVIVAMGRFALEVLTQSTEHLGGLRGKVHAFAGVPVIATYHPNALLRTPADKAKAWADLCQAMDVVAQPVAP